MKTLVIESSSAGGKRYAPVAQLDRVTGYEPVGQGFESLPAYHLTGCPIRDNLLNFYAEEETGTIKYGTGKYHRRGLDRCRP